LIDPSLTILLIWHVGSVVLWLGSSATFVVVVYPSLGSLSQDESRLFLRSFFPKFSKLLGASSVSTVVAGVLLYGYVSSVSTAITPTGWRTVFLLLGGVLGMIAAFLTLGVALPLASRFMNPSSQASNGPKYTVLDEATMVNGMNWVMRAIVVILSLTFVLMVTGAF
jgi:uncharacterized membrane protein